MVNQEDMAISFCRHLENKSKKKSKCISQIAKNGGGKGVKFQVQKGSRN